MRTKKRPKSAPASELPVEAVGASTGEFQVSFRMQRLETDVGFALGALALWIQVFLHPPGFVVWLLALLGVAVAGWSRNFPARRPLAMVARAAVLVVGGAILLSAPGTGGPTGPAVMWLLATAMAYGVLLPLRWGAVVAAASLATYVGAWMLADPPPPWQAAAAFGGGLCILGALFLTMGRSLRKSERLAEQGRMDERSLLYNEAGFFAHGGELFQAARQRGQPFTLVLLQATDLRDASQMLGRRVASALFEQTVKGIAGATPPGGIAARTDTVEFAVAVAGVGKDKAEALLHQRLGRPLQVKVGLGGTEAAIMLDAVVSEAPPELHTLEDLYDRLRQRLHARSAGAPITQSTDRGGASTLQGFLLQDPPMPQSLRPTLPAPLLRDRKAKPGAKRAAPPPTGSRRA